MYIRRDVLANATRQFKVRAGLPAANEPYLATHGINVLLHELAHASAGIRDEATAQCWAGQWLDDFEVHYEFSIPIINADETAFWDEYNERIAARDSYGSESCATASWDAPDLITAAREFRPTRPVGANTRPALDPAFILRDRWATTSYFGRPMPSIPRSAGTVYVFFQFGPGYFAVHHEIVVQWVAPDSSVSIPSISITGFGPYWDHDATWFAATGGVLQVGTWVARYWLDGRYSGALAFTVA